MLETDTVCLTGYGVSYKKREIMFSAFCCAIASGTILVIDDEITILKMLKLELTRLGFLVDTAGSGEEGLEKINSNKYSLILTDIKMPGISGNQILHYVKDEKKVQSRLLECLELLGFRIRMVLMLFYQNPVR